MNKLLKPYASLVEYLGFVLGPSYEVVLYDIENKDMSIVAIANGFISGRSLFDPITDKNLKLLDKIKEDNKNFYVNYNSYSRDGKRLRGSSFYIKNEKGDLVGILCINFDDSKYVELTHDILGLCHPDALLSKNSYEQIDDHYYDEDTEHYGKSITDIAKNIVLSTIEHKKIPIEDMTKDDKIKIVTELNSKGVFLLKGAISAVAKLMNTSDATLYRYLSEVVENEANEK